MLKHNAPVGHVARLSLDIGQGMVRHPLARKMALRAGQRPVCRKFHHAGGDRVSLDRAHGRHKMEIIHRVAGKSRLEKMTAPAFENVDHSGEAPVRLAEQCQRLAPILFAKEHLRAPVAALRHLTRSAGYQAP